MSVYNALRVIVAFLGSVAFVIIVDWPVIAGWVEWLPPVSQPSNSILEVSTWLYDSTYATYRTLVALMSVAMAFIMNLWPARLVAELR